MAKDARLKIYPAVIGVLGICLITLLLTRLEIRIEPPVPPQEPEAAIPKPTSPGEPLPVTPLPSPAASPSSAPLPAPSPAAASPPTPAAPPVKPQVATTGGRVRVSNQTGSPVRVALLPHVPSASPMGAAATGDRTSAYGQPVHWDFAPGEGSTAGLLLSLPDGEVKLQTGDVLIAFAQDGSGRYWGPYVLGETSLPTWSAASKEWQLMLDR